MKAGETRGRKRPHCRTACPPSLPTILPCAGLVDGAALTLGKPMPAATCHPGLAGEGRARGGSRPRRKGLALSWSLGVCQVLYTCLLALLQDSQVGRGRAGVCQPLGITWRRGRIQGCKEGLRGPRVGVARAAVQPELSCLSLLCQEACWMPGTHVP